MNQEKSNTEILREAYEKWDATKGGSKEHWLSIMTDDIDFHSLADGDQRLAFTKHRSAREEVADYLDGLTAQLEMLHYTVDEYVAQGDRVVAIGTTAWKNRENGKEFETPKVDLVRFRDGKICSFFELYDTAKVLASSEP